MPRIPKDRVLAEQALNTLEAAIWAVIQNHGKRQELHVRICWRNGGLPNGYELLAERCFGAFSSWEYPYDQITHDKASMTAESGLTSRDLIQKYPQFLDEADGEFWGSAQRGNLIVACSGVEPELDEAIAEMVVSLLWALMQLATPQGAMVARG